LAKCQESSKILATKVTEANISKAIASYLARKTYIEPDVTLEFPKGVTTETFLSRMMKAATIEDATPDNGLKITSLPRTLFDSGLWLNQNWMMCESRYNSGGEPLFVTAYMICE
jgi:hypothetical protein